MLNTWFLSLATLSHGLGLMCSPFWYIKIWWLGARGCENTDCWVLPPESNSVAQVRPKNLHFKQVPRWCWCGWSRNYILRYAVLVPSLLFLSNCELFLKKKLLCLPQLFLISSCWIAPINQRVIKHRILKGLDPCSFCIDFKKTKQWYK